MRGFSTGRRRRMSLTRTAAAMVAGALLLTAAFAPASMAAAPTPNEGSATVDGAIGDWSLSADFFVDMTAGGVAGRPVRAKLYLKYDCDAEVLYALVLAQGDEKARQTRPDEAYINIDGQQRSRVPDPRAVRLGQRRRHAGRRLRRLDGPRARQLHAPRARADRR